jgi:chromosome segregation ATPase
MELPVIIFILLFFLVIILILLHRSNKKHADKISVLEQTLDMKVDAITSLKETYAESRRAIDKHAAQAHEILDKKQTIVKLEANKVSLKATVVKKNTEIEQHHVKHAKSAEETRQKVAKFNAEAKAQVLVMDGLKHMHNEEMREADTKKLALENTINSKTDKNRELSSLLTQTIMEKKEEKKRLDTTISNNHEAIQTLKSDYAKSQELVKKNYAQYEAKLVAKDEEMTKLNTGFNKLVQELQENVANKTQMIKESETRYTQTVQSYEENIHGFKEEIEVQSKKITSLIAEQKIEQKEASDKRENLENKIVGLEADIRNLELQYKETVDTYNKEVIHLKQGIATEHNKIETLIEEHRMQVEAYALQNTQNKKVIQDKLESIVRLEKNNANQVIKINGLEEDKMLKNNEYESLYKEYQISEKEAKKQKDLLEQNILKLQNHIEKLDHNIVALKQNMEGENQTIQVLEHQYTETVDKYDEDITRLKKEISVGNSKLEGLIVEHRTEVEVYESQNTQNKNVIQNKLKAIALLETDNANYRMQINIREEDKVLKKHEYSHLEKQYAQEKLEAMDKIRILENTIVNKTKDLQIRSSSLEQMRLAYESEHDKLEFTLLTHTREISTLEEKAKRSYEISVAKYAEYDKELENMTELKEQLEIDKNKQISALNKTMLEAQKMLTGVHEKEVNREKENEHKIIKLSQQIEEREQSIHKLTSMHKKENVEVLSTHDEVMKAIHEGEPKGTVSKKLGIPIKRIELIIKFDKIQQKSQSVS